MHSQNSYFKNLLFSAQYKITVASHIRVPIDWKDENFIPELNRFYLILDGEGIIKLNGKQYYPKPGQLFLLPAGVTLSYSTISEHTFLKYWTHFTAKVGGRNLFQYMSLPAFVEVDCLDSWTLKFAALQQACAREDYISVFKQQALLLDIIASFMELSPFPVQLRVTEVMEKMDAILTYIDNHLDSTFTVEQLARHFHYHPNHLIRVFKKFTGTSPIQYINQRRIEVAKLQLISSDLSVSEISSSVGMEPHYFSRVFKEYTGYAPSHYRKWHPPLNRD